MMADFATGFRDGVDINLGVGYVNEQTIPTVWLREALDAIMTRPEEHRQAFNYGGPQGSPNLLRALRAFLLRTGRGGLDSRTLDRVDLVVGPSGATSILDAVADILEPGIVVTADPMYYIYCNYLERKGFRIVTVPEDEQGVDPDRLEERLGALGNSVRDLAFFYFVTVNNPSCTVLSNARRRRLADVAARVSAQCGRVVPILFDEAYAWLLHDPDTAPIESALPHDTAGVVYEIGTLSKVLAPALRAGFVMGPPGGLMRAIVQKTSDVGFSAPLLTQEMAAYMLDHHIDAQLQRVNTGYREKARAVRAAIDARLGPWLADCRGGKAGFYFYLTLDGIRTDTDSPFFRFLTRSTGDPEIDGPESARNPRVIYIPGAYCVHPGGEAVEEGRRQLRLSYGFEEPRVIERALAHMRDAAAHAREQERA
jgi:DNA-binding transcriptional MocR family regulator